MFVYDTHSSPVSAFIFNTEGTFRSGLLTGNSFLFLN